MSHFMITTLKPVRSKGEIIDGNEFFDPVASPRAELAVPARNLPGAPRAHRRL